MIRYYFKFLTALLFITSVNTYGQLYDIFQVTNIEKFQGKNFTLEGKIYYKDAITNDSWLVLAALSVDDKGKVIKAPIYNDNAGDYYKKGEWSSYQLKGKIEKKATYLAVGITIAGNGSYYLDDFKLFVGDGKNRIEIPLANAGFENDSLTNWQNRNFDKNTTILPSKEMAFTGAQSLFIDNSKVVAAPTLGNNPEVGKYMDVNGIKLYYEIYGEGEPLLLIHGNNSSMGRFDKQLEALTKKYKVIALDSRGQGKSTDDQTKITYELMAGDIAVFLEKLQLKKVNILGWSDGGNIAVILGMLHPDKVNKMAIMGTVLYNNDSSVTSETNKLLHQQVKEMTNRGVSETSMDYRLKMLLLTEPNINPDALEKIQAPTLVMAGEHDVVKEKHTKLIAAKIPNSQLVIFKGADHEAPAKIPQLFNETVLKFFDSPVK
ncbi:alpha/beta fold hydrolase [Flavobacterium cerinum]|uniref:Alpha/beta hydrolase n=1 Tax=Flavobacterium cerinum TaxID=2502784 RepID=A0ABY5IPF4_9FLAO|nr:alpha/beta hydrolase [Flavobacterium cerinum]UUC44712.1 alpha/beta hydrolase [Flavobacterium cerinum]